VRILFVLFMYCLNCSDISMLTSIVKTSFCLLDSLLFYILNITYEVINTNGSSLLLRMIGTHASVQTRNAAYKIDILN